MLQGSARFFYYVSLVAVALGVGITGLIRRSFLGYVWRAMRDDEDASRALGVRTFIHKILVVSISGAWAAVGGGILALVQGSIFPDSIMSMGISVVVLMGPVVGGLGTAFGPLIGALIIIPVDHLMGFLGDKIGIPGLNNVALWNRPDRRRLVVARRSWPPLFKLLRWEAVQSASRIAQAREVSQ